MPLMGKICEFLVRRDVWKPNWTLIEFWEVIWKFILHYRPFHWHTTFQWTYQRLPRQPNIHGVNKQSNEYNNACNEYNIHVNVYRSFPHDANICGGTFFSEYNFHGLRPIRGNQKIMLGESLALYGMCSANDWPRSAYLHNPISF